MSYRHYITLWIKHMRMSSQSVLECICLFSMSNIFILFRGFDVSIPVPVYGQLFSGIRRNQMCLLTTILLE